MKLLLFYPCLFATLFQALFASTSSDGPATLKSEGSSKPMVKPVVGKSIRKRKALDATKKNKRVRTSGVVIREDRPKALSEILPKGLVEIVIGYFKDDIYSILVSTHDWLLKDRPKVALDSTRLYVMPIRSQDLKGLNHSLASLKEEERCFIELGSPEWFNYGGFSSSHDGRYVSFCCFDMQIKSGTKWLTQDNEFGGFKPVVFDSEDSYWGKLSRDGQTLFSYSRIPGVTRVYQIKEEAGKDPTAFLKLELNGEFRAVSGKGNRVMVVKNEMHLEIHDISKGAGDLVCRIGDFGYVGALNEDGSEAAFVDHLGDTLRVIEVNTVIGDSVDQPAIVTVKNLVSSVGSICQLVYSDRSKLHVLSGGGGVSLFDPSAKTLIPIEVPQKGQWIVGAAISPDADYIAIIQHVGKEEKDGKRLHRTTVKRKLGDAEWKDLFGYERVSSTKSSVLPEKALTQARNALPQSSPRTKSTTISVKGGILCAFDGNLAYRYVLDDGWVIHRSIIDSGDDRGSVKLPASLVKGAPQHMQTNSDGTIFYVATKRNKTRHIYIIDVASKGVYGYYLKHLESDIAEMKVHVGGNVLEVTTQDREVLVFSCNDQRLSLRNKLVGEERIIGVSQSIAVFEKKDKASGPTIGYFDLTKTGASLCSLPYRNVMFVAVNKDDVYLTNAKWIILFSVKTRRITTFEGHYNVRYSQVHNGSLRIIDHAFVYRTLNIEPLRSLYEAHLPLPVLQKDKELHILISLDGQRVMMHQAGTDYLFRIVGPEFAHKTPTTQKPAETKLVDTRGSLVGNLADNGLRQFVSLFFELLSKMLCFVKKRVYSRS